MISVGFPVLAALAGAMEPGGLVSVLVVAGVLPGPVPLNGVVTAMAVLS